MTQDQLEYFKEKLLEQKDRIMNDLDHLKGASLNNSRESSGDLSGYSFHLADQGTDNFDREFAIELATNEQGILYEIDEALVRIVDGSFGKCEECPKDVGINRLEALPFARLCIECKSKEETRGKN